MLNVRDFKATGDGVTDDTAAFTAAVSALGTRGGTILVPPGVYNCPNGIVTTSDTSFRVVGEGNRYGGVGVPGATGSVIKTSAPGAWCWDHVNPSAPRYIRYRGPAFENLTFLGNGGTAGGVRVAFTCFSAFHGCLFAGHTSGTGLSIQRDVTVNTTDASWWTVDDCVAQDNLTGYDLAAGGELVASVSLKTSGGGIVRTGYGTILRDSNIRVTGGKDESSDVGMLVTAVNGVTVMSRGYEGNVSQSLLLDRPAATVASRHRIVAPYVVGPAPVTFGVNQSRDVLVAPGYCTIVDHGLKTVIVGGDL